MVRMLGGAAVFAGLYFLSIRNFLLFHSLIEIFSVIIGVSIFVIAWNSRRHIDNHYLVFLGMSFLFSGGLNLLHALAYKGMSVFPGATANLPTQLWIAFRYVLSFSFLIAPVFVKRKLVPAAAFAGYSAFTVLLLCAIFLWSVFPACYMEGSGLTQFKIVSEYIISFIFLASLGMLYRNRRSFDREVFLLLAAAIVAAVAAEVSFTQYVSVYGAFNALGHFFNLIFFFCVYKAIIETGLARPYDLIFRDLKRSEEELRESEEKYRSLFENLLSGFAYHKIILDDKEQPIDYLFIEINDAFERLTGLKRLDIIGKTVTQIIPEIKSSSFDWIGEYGKVALTGTPLRTEQFAEQLGMWYSVSAYCPKKGYFAAVIDDITERRQAAEDVLKLSEEMAVRNVELEAVNRELEAFTYSVSHDLRAPLRTMSSFSRFLAEDYAGQLDEQGKDYLARIGKGTEKMSLLINDLLQLSKISRQEIEKTKVDISKAASSIVAELREAHANRSVEVDITEGLFAFADPHLTEIVLTNLLENAWKFTSTTENARIELGTLNNFKMQNAEYRVKKSGDNGEIVYYVRDNGAGFNPAYADKLFRPFQRLHSTQEFKGTGIGLAIVERVILRHGGRVWAEGETGKGAVVYFTLGR